MSNNLQPPDGVPLEVWRTLAVDEGTRWAIAERNADGEIVGTAYRLPDGSKDFKKGGKRGLILPWPFDAYAGTGADDPVFVCEGASDTASMLGIGLQAVGIPSAGQCCEWLATLLKGRHAVAVADADKAGARGADEIVGALVPDGASVRRILPPKGAKDAREAIIGGATAAEFLALAKAAKFERPESVPKPGAPVLIRMSDVEPRETRWLWPQRVPSGRLTVLCGRPGEGKSMMTMDMAARVTRGLPWPDGGDAPKGSVLIVTTEDDAAETIRPRLDAHGADPAKVRLMPGVHRIGRDGKPTVGTFTLDDLEPLKTALESMPDCVLVIVDPIGSFIGGRVDAHRDNEIRAVLAPLAVLAQQTGAAMLLVAHERKGAANHADDLVLGSRAFTGLARSVLHLLRDPDDEARRLLLPGKSNLSAPAPGLAFSIVPNPVRVDWEPNPVSTTASEVLAAQRRAGSGRTERDDAAEWLYELLADGPVLAKDAMQEAKDAGHALGTLRRAKAALKVKSRKRGFKGPHEWYIPAPDDAHAGEPDAEDAQSGATAHLRTKPDENLGVEPKVRTSESVRTFGDTPPDPAHLRGSPGTGSGALVNAPGKGDQ